ncbi:MAG: serine hydrolase domain-containing protein [Blastocatellia bacterium]
MPLMTRRNCVFTWLFVCLSVFCPDVIAQDQAQRLSSVAPPPRFSDPNRAARLAAAYPEVDKVMRDFATKNHVPGMAWGVIVDGRLAQAGAIGIRDMDKNAPVDADTVFRIASMTKSFTAAAILQLRDAGRLSLDDAAARYMPELRQMRLPTADSRPITIRDLLSHSAGFPEDNPWGDQQLAATEASFSAMLRRGFPFSHTPGVAYEYSNLGFAMLGRIVTVVSRMPYERYVTERLLRPLGMMATTFEAASVPATRLAHGYRRQDDRWIIEPALPHGAFGAMGGMLTTAGDLSKWVAFMLDAWPPRDGADNGPLKRASRREMQQVARFSGGFARRDADNNLSLSIGGYGYGLGARQTCNVQLSVSHGGGLPGYGSHMRWLPDYGVGIVTMCNLTYTGASGAVEQALLALSRTGALAPREIQPAPVLLERQAQITRLISAWDDGLADSLAAMNLFLDESKPRRREAIEKLVKEAGGSCRPEGAIVPENALRGAWRMRCAGADLRVSMTLAPVEPATVQFLEVAPLKPEDSLAPPAACR